jgi:hypothetical protein
MRRVVLAALALLAFALPASAQASRACGHIKTSAYADVPVQVAVSRGGASCAEAQKIASKALSHDPGPFHGADLASGYWLVYGWKCQRGTDGASGCTRGARNLIRMQAQLPAAVPGTTPEEAAKRTLAVVAKACAASHPGSVAGTPVTRQEDNTPYEIAESRSGSGGTEYECEGGEFGNYWFSL